MITLVLAPISAVACVIVSLPVDPVTDARAVDVAPSTLMLVPKLPVTPLTSIAVTRLCEKVPIVVTSSDVDVLTVPLAAMVSKPVAFPEIV